MKILIVNKFLYYNGGSETYMIKLGEYLKSIGHEVQYFGMFDERNVVGNDYGAYVKKVDFHSSGRGAFKKFKMGIETVYSKQARIEIGKLLKAFQPDVVHMNNINFQLTPAIIFEIKKYNIALLQTVHDVQIACPCHRFYIEHKEQLCEQCRDGHYYHCIMNKCLQNSIIKSMLAAVESYYYHSRNIYNLVDLYICPSRFIGEKIVSAGVDREKIKVIYNFAEKIEKTKARLKRDKYVLYFGRLSKEKGILSLIKVCKNLPEIKLVIAGKGPLEQIVKKHADESPNINYVGFKTGSELQEIIAEAAFCVFPSEWYENCPLSVIEAQTLGTPVICSDLGGTKELIINKKTGLIFKGCDMEKLRYALCRLWKDDKFIAYMSRECENISWMVLEEYAKVMVELYKGLIDGKDKSSVKKSNI